MLFVPIPIIMLDTIFQFQFSQNPHLRRILLATSSTTLVEASPYDKLWGIGLDADHHDATNPSLWRGSNWLGRILCEVRDNLSQ